MEKILKVNASDFFDDDNEGFIYGLEFYDDEYDDLFPVDCQWFKTEAQREIEIKNLLRENPNLIIE